MSGSPPTAEPALGGKQATKKQQQPPQPKAEELPAPSHWTHAQRGGTKAPAQAQQGSKPMESARNPQAQNAGGAPHASSLTDLQAASVARNIQSGQALQAAHVGQKGGAARLENAGVGRTTSRVTQPPPPPRKPVGQPHPGSQPWTTPQPSWNRSVTGSPQPAAPQPRPAANTRVPTAR